MTHRIFRLFSRSAALGIAALLMGSTTADAGWWHGSSGGSYSSYGGSYGGSYGSYGSYGSTGSGSYGGLFGRWRQHHQVRWHSSHGSSGGSYGGNYGSYGSSGGSHGSSGGGYAYRSRGWGSSGGSHGNYGSAGGYSSSPYYTAPNYAPGTGSPYYSTPSQMVPGTTTPESSAKPAIDGEIPAPATGTDANPANGSATLTISVPSEALVYVNGVQTRSTGELRRYVSRGLNEGFSYTYDVKVTMVRNGRLVEENKLVQLNAGDNTDLAFAMNAKGNVETSLTLKVPENATVALAGSTTNMSGAVRVFKTFALDEGAAWEDYKVVVSVERDGQLVSQEKAITLKSGEAQTLSFEFDSAQVAAR